MDIVIYTLAVIGIIAVIMVIMFYYTVIKKCDL